MISKQLLVEAISMLPVSSKDPTRINICGVLIRAKKDKVTLVATDGRMLFERTTKGPCPDGEFMLDLDAVKVLKCIFKEVKHADEIPATVNDRGDMFVGLEFGAKVSIPKLQGDYPKYETVIPEYVAGTTVGITLNAEYLLAIAEAFKAGEKRGSLGITLEFDPTSPLKPCLVHGCDGAVGVVMPIRADKSKSISDAYKARLEANNKGAA